jgi:hypothetical protein
VQFSTAKALLLAQARAVPEAHVHLAESLVEVTFPLRVSGEVELFLVLALRYSVKRRQSHFESSLCLRAPRLITHPTDGRSLALLGGMPSRILNQVVALRKRLNGKVPFIRLSSLVPQEPLFVEGGTIDLWNEDDLLHYLLVSFALAHFVAAAPLPARTAEQLLHWARRGHKVPLGKEVIDSWSVAERGENAA